MLVSRMDGDPVPMKTPNPQNPKRMLLTWIINNETVPSETYLFIFSLCISSLIVRIDFCIMQP